MSRGCFIAFEGGEGAGKSTQARLLAGALAARGIDALLTREPGGTPGAEAIRALLLEPDSPDWSAPAEALLFAAARADHVTRLIAPALAAGRWVICDRFVDSSRAYQGGAGGLTDADVLALHRVGSGGLLPDATLLLELPVELATVRLRQRDGGTHDRIGGRSAAFHAGVAAAFARIATAEPARVSRIAADADPAAVHARVLAAMAPLLTASGAP